MDFCLSSYIKSIFAFRAHNGMLPFCLWKAKDYLARRTFSVYVSLPVSSFVFHELEISHEPFIFPSSLLYITRHHSEENDENKCPREYYKYKGEICHVIHKQSKNHLQKHKPYVAPEQHTVKGIRAVSAVHKSIKSSFYFPHSI